MKKLHGIIWGLVLIALGVIIAGNSLHIFDVDLFFDGWWTLFIIVPCAISFITEKGKGGSLIGLLVGVLLLLACQNVIDFDMAWKILLPAIIIIIGLSIIFKSIFGRKFCDDIEKLNKQISKDGTIGAVFSSQNISFKDQEFTGINLSAVFGAIELDLRNAKIKDDVVVNATAIFGGIEIISSDDVNVVLKSSSVFGGADNGKDGKMDKKHTVYVNATCVFGGLDIK